MIFGLQKTALIDGKEYPFRYDFRVILEIIIMLSDPDLSDSDKVEALLQMFYLNPEDITDYKEAVNQCFQFIDHSDRQVQKRPRLVDWEQDYEYIIAPVNRVLGYEARDVAYDPETNTGGLHWWTFLAAYMEIGGDCLFSQIISIRDKRARKKKLEKYEKEWLKRNYDIVNIKQRYSDSEDELVKAWT